MPVGFNEIPNSETESMIQFHIQAVNDQLQQLYYGFAIAMALNRTLLLPKMHCYCSKNWYMTFACRINDERLTQFPFVCALSHVLRAKLLDRGLVLTRRGQSAPSVVHIREYSFLTNPATPEIFQTSHLDILPDPKGPAAPTADLSSRLLPAITTGPSGRQSVTLPWPLTERNLLAALQPHAGVRTLHFTDAKKTFGALFGEFEFQKRFDELLQSRVAYWCCRSPADMTGKNLTDKVQLSILPPARLQIK
ncbi:MAG: hypothetical protein WDW38_001988 [Sanguina aurantia]